jgi:mutual gliding-motility protein MglA
MAEIVLKDRVVRLKIVYYGPALGGKTTNLRTLHARAAAGRRGELLSVNSFQDRTVLFDMLPLQAVGPRGFDIRLQLVAVPGQAAYALSRRVALKGADAVVFVANSATDRREENIQAMRELHVYLRQQGLDPDTIPMVIQYNKRDLPSVMSPSQMDADLNPRRVPVWNGVARQGEGVVETFRAVLMGTARDVWRRYPLLSGTDLQPDNWARSAVAGLFTDEAGVVTTGQPPVEIPVAVSTSTQVAPQAAVARVVHVAAGTRTDASTIDKGTASVAEAYADACSQLARAYNDAISGRSTAERRLADIQRALLVAEHPVQHDLDSWVRRMLSCLAEGAEAAQASFVRTKPGETPHVVTLPPLSEDPLLCNTWGQKLIETVADTTAAQLWEGAERADVKALLSKSERAFSAVAAVPVNFGGRSLGLVLLYFVEGDALPGVDALQHLSALARLFGPSLQLALLAAATAPRRRAQSMAISAAVGA